MQWVNFTKPLADYHMSKPKILYLDIETAPILGYVWGLWDNNLALNQVKKDWFILSFSAKWADDPSNKIIYRDQRNQKNIEDDSSLLKEIWNLLNECDIIVTQNGKRFDSKKINARFILNGMKPPAPYKHIDTHQIAKKHFGFTSTKLEYMSEKLCSKYKKQKHAKFSGFELWRECLSNNPEAWKEMEKYNKYDVLSLQELHEKLSPWDNSINFNLYHDGVDHVCNCGSKKLVKRGFAYTKVGKFRRFVCKVCGTWSKSSKNLFTKEKRESLLRKID